MNKDYNASITVMPNGQVFADEHSSYSAYPRSGLLASYKKNKKTGLFAKTVFHDSKTYKMAEKLSQNQDIDIGQLSAATTIADKTNISHLQLIKLYPELQGTPTEYFYLDELFVPRDVPQLEARETFYDTTASAEYKNRLEESKATRTNYDEIKYALLKLTDKVYTPIEDLMRTIINPEAVDLGQLRYGFKWKRNQSALAALGTIGNSQTAIHDPTLMATNGVQSLYNTANQLATLFASFLATNDVVITHVGMNTTDFMNYTSNTWTKQGPFNIEPIRLTGGGVVPMPGIQGVTAVVDLAIPQGTIYAVNKPNALRIGEGPKIMRRYYDEERDAEAVKVLDFHQYLAVGAQLVNIQRKFGMTIPVLNGS